MTEPKHPVSWGRDDRDELCWREHVLGRVCVLPEGHASVSATDDIETLCEVMHDAYEAAAVEAGWETQARSRVPWAEVPEANKATMRAAVMALMLYLRS
jgi:hypothetical protein